MQDQIDEALILGPLKRDFKEFAQFCEKEYKKVSPIPFIEDSELSEDLCAYYHKGQNKIYYKKISGSKMDAHLIAHEIMHAVRAKENNLLTIRYFRREHERLAMAINSLLEDQTVDSILQRKYGFDLLPLYIWSIEFTETHVNNISLSPLGQVYSGIRFANTMLRWDLIKDKDASKRWKEHLTWSRTQSLDVHKIAKDVAGIVRSLKLEPITQHKKIVATLINRYELQNVLSV